MTGAFLTLQFSRAGQTGLMHALSRHGAFIHGDDKYFSAAGAGGGDHAFAGAEFHFAWGEVGDADHEAAE